MRLIATAVACVLAAFGAAFLVGRAANREDSATAATTTTVHHGTPVATPVTTASTHADRALAAQFQPGLKGLRHKRKARRRVVHRSVPAPAVAAPQTTTQSYTPPPTYTAPAYTAPAYTRPAPTTHHKSGGSGTTTIG